MCQDNRGHLSARGTFWARTERNISCLDVANDPWDKNTNPEGFVGLGIAENNLMHDEITDHLNSKIEITPSLLGFGNSLGGSHRLREATASFLHRHFQPANDVSPEHIFVTSGVLQAMEAVAFSICAPGDGIMLARPFYRGFPSALGARARSNTRLVEISTEGVDPFCMEVLARYEEALVQAATEKVPIKAIMLCNPHSPLGRCYSREVLEGYMRLCQKYRIHLLSDEIYALSGWENSECPEASGFCSVLSIETEGLIDGGLVHAFWGMSKDIGCNGLRLGFIVSQRNDGLHRALESNSVFLRPSKLAINATTILLRDQSFMDLLIYTNRARLGANYAYVTKKLQKYGVPFEKICNSSIFIWADLFGYFRPQHILRDRVTDEAWALELKLNDALLEHKVFLGRGSTFASHHAGWFCITFSFNRRYLDEGLDRMMTALHEFERSALESYN